MVPKNFTFTAAAALYVLFSDKTMMLALGPSQKMKRRRARSHDYILWEKRQRPPSGEGEAARVPAAEEEHAEKRREKEKKKPIGERKERSLKVEQELLTFEPARKVAKWEGFLRAARRPKTQVLIIDRRAA